MKAETGSISQATMQPRDLIPCFADELERLDEEKVCTNLIEEARSYKDEDYENSDIFPEDVQYKISCTLNELFEALNEFALPYCYFGAHEGDGADYGFWIAFDCLDTEGILKVDDLADIPDDWHEYVLLVNDHGNATLYQPRIEWQEVWSVI